MDNFFYSEIADYLKFQYPNQDIQDKLDFLVDYNQKILSRSKKRAGGKYVIIILLFIFLILNYFFLNTFILASSVLIFSIYLFLIIQNNIILNEFEKTGNKIKVDTYRIIVDKEADLNSSLLLDFIIIGESLLIIGLFHNNFPLLMGGLITAIATRFLLKHYMDSNYNQDIKKVKSYIEQ